MTDAKLHAYRQTLLDLRRRLRGESDRLSAEALRPARVPAEGNSANAPPGDEGDESVDAATHDVSLGLMANERQLLAQVAAALQRIEDRKSTRLNSSHRCISYAVF